MAISGTFDARGPHRALGHITLEVDGGLLAIHHAHPGRQGSVYWPRAACVLSEDPRAATVTLIARGIHGEHPYPLTPHDSEAARMIRETLGASPTLLDNEWPRRPVQLDHQWPYAAPWQSVRQLARELNRPAKAALPFIVPYAWLQLRREARRHPPEAIEGFHRYAMGDFEGARKALREALAAASGDYDAFYLYLHTFVRQFDFDGALACAAEFGMEAKMRASHIDNDIRLLDSWRRDRHGALYYRETKDREGIALIGETGEALTMLRPAGKVRVGTREWSARTEGSFASPGSAVEVIGWDGISLIVRTRPPGGIE